MKNILKLEGFLNSNKSTGISENRRLAHKENIRNIVDENNNLHRKIRNSIIEFIRESGVSKIKLKYNIPYTSDTTFIGITSHGFAITTSGKEIDLGGIRTDKLIEIYESLVY
jgi:hypothetical protein